MNIDHSLNAKIRELDPTAIVACGRALANRAIALGIFAVSAMITERERERTNHDANSQLVGKDVSAANQTTDQRDPPVGLEARKTPAQRLGEAAYLYAYGNSLCEEYGESDFDRPQTVANRLDWQIQTLRADLATPLPNPTNSVAGNVAMRTSRTRNQAQLDFLTSWKAEIVLELTGHFHTVDDHDADNYASTVTGLERYQATIACVEGLAQRVRRLNDQICKMRPGGTLTQKLTSDLAVIEGSWKKMRRFAEDLEVIDSAELLAALERGINVRDLHSSDQIIASLGIDIAKATA